MSRLRPSKLHVTFGRGITTQGPLRPRRYTLTHSDATGDLYLTVAADYDRRQISGWYTRLMRDEVLAEWREDEDGPALHVYCHVSGGFAIGPPAWRDAILRREMPLVLETFRYGDRALCELHPELDHAPVIIHFQARQRRYRRAERWGCLEDYRLKSASGRAGS
jgi:hypothetical protein